MVAEAASTVVAAEAVTANPGICWLQPITKAGIVSQPMPALLSSTLTLSAAPSSAQYSPLSWQE